MVHYRRSIRNVHSTLHALFENVSRSLDLGNQRTARRPWFVEDRKKRITSDEGEYMPKRLLILIGVVSLFFLNVMTARADDPPGAKLYATYCGACHGAAGKGGFAPAIGRTDYLTVKDDATLIQIT